MTKASGEPVFFSIIVVSLNAGEKLKSTLQSILEQTETSYEVLVQDGGSVDDSIPQAIAWLSERTGAAVDIRCEKDEGIYDGMNKAMARAAGKYLYFLNCGDCLCDSGVLAAVKKALEEAARTTDRPLLCYGDVRDALSGAVVPANPELDDFALFRHLPCHQACFYDRRLFASRGFDTRYLVRADYEHFLWCHYEQQAAYVPLPLTVATYEGGGFSETEKGRRLSAEEHREITEKYMGPEMAGRFRRRMWWTLQPVRERLSRWPVTAGLYQRLKAGHYDKKRRRA